MPRPPLPGQLVKPARRRQPGDFVSMHPCTALICFPGGNEEGGKWEGRKEPGGPEGAAGRPSHGPEQPTFSSAAASPSAGTSHATSASYFHMSAHRQCSEPGWALAVTGVVCEADGKIPFKKLAFAMSLEYEKKTFISLFRL